MKFNKWKQITVLVMAAAALAVTQLSAMADPTALTYPTGSPNFSTPDTNAIPLVLTNGAGVTFPANGTNSLEKAVRQDHGLSVFVTVVTTNAAVGGQTLGWDTSPDGTLYTTTQPLKWTLPANGAGTNTYWTNWPAAQLNNVRDIQLTTVTNAAVGTGNTNTATITKLIYSQSGNLP